MTTLAVDGGIDGDTIHDAAWLTECPPKRHIRPESNYFSTDPLLTLGRPSESTSRRRG